MGTDDKGFRPRGGRITDRLRRLFSADDPAWFPGRGTGETRRTPLPTGRDGWSVGEGANRDKIHGRGARKGKHRG